jgi:hypothetical protein
MQDVYIDCVKKDWQGVITHVGIGGRAYEVIHVVQELLEKRYPVHTIENNQRARVYPRLSVNGNWFLTTTPDSITENNLDFLPTCFQ